MFFPQTAKHLRLAHPTLRGHMATQEWMSHPDLQWRNYVDKSIPIMISWASYLISSRGTISSCISPYISDVSLHFKVWNPLLEVALLAFNVLFMGLFPIFFQTNGKSLIIKTQIHRFKRRNFPSSLVAEKCDLLQRPRLPAASHLPSELQRKSLWGDQWNDEPRLAAEWSGAIMTGALRCLPPGSLL